MHGGVDQEVLVNKFYSNIDELLPDVLNVATLERLREIPPFLLRNFSSEQIQAIPGFHLPYLHRDQVVELLTYHASTLHSEQLIHLIPHYLTHLPLREWLKIPPAVIRGITLEDFVKIPPQFIVALGKEQLDAITEEQIAALTLPQVYEGILPCFPSLKPLQKGSFLRRHLSRLSAELIRKLPKTIICDIPTKDISQLPPHLFSQFSKPQLTHMDAEKIGNMVLEQVFEILFYRPEDWTSEQITFIPPAIIAEIPGEHITHLRSEVFCAFSAEQFNYLSGLQIRALQRKHIAALDEQQLQKLQGSFIGNLPVTSIAYFSRSQQIALLKQGKIAYFLDAQIHALEPDIADSIWSLRAAFKNGITDFKKYLPLECSSFNEMPIVTEEICYHVRQDLWERNDDSDHYVSA